MTDQQTAGLGHNILSAKELASLISYDPMTGKLHWLDRPLGLFKTKRAFSTWNARYAGCEALTALNGSGYLHGGILGQKHRAHRVIWALQTGDWPEEDIDHINGVRSDNSWSNLRAVSRSDNMRNAAMPCTNTSGHVGVHWCKPLSKWAAQIMDDGKSIHLGNFIEKADAIQARKSAENERGYHANHGRQQ
tara:strand:+ start:9 stop:581 length:573 start_codon:yes stop_codon:yes gene_type:complete